jgi:hypothetical protein
MKKECRKEFFLFLLPVFNRIEDRHKNAGAKKRVSDEAIRTHHNAKNDENHPDQAQVRELLFRSLFSRNKEQYSNNTKDKYRECDERE